MTDLWEGTEAPSLPEAIEAERDFLSTVLAPGNDGQAYEQSLVVMPEWFHKPQHRMIWEAGAALATEGTEISVSSICHKLGQNLPKVGGPVSVIETLQGDLVERPEVLAGIIRSKWEAREAILALGKALEAIQKDGSVGNSLGLVGSLADAFAPRGEAIKNYSDLFETLEAGNGALPIDRANNLPIFGIEPLDRTLGAMGGTLGVVAAKTSAGKSSLAYQICVRSALRGRKVLLVSLEADREEVASAIAANLNSVNRSMLLRSGLPDIQVSGIVKTNLMGYHAGSGATWDSLEKAIRLENRRSPFSVVIVDYFTLLEPPSYKGNRNMASLYGEISKGCKRLAQQLNCSVVLLSQFNRGVEDGQEPFLENLRETGQLEQDADWVVLLWAKPEDEPDGFRYVNAKVAKNRKGKRGEKFRMKLFPAESRFEESFAETRRP